MAMGIYMLENLSTGHFYVGSAVDLAQRKSTHFSQLRSGTHFNPRLQRSFEKHGGRGFKFIVLAYCAPKELLRWEQFFIDKLRPVYNVQLVAGSSLGQHRSVETCAKIAASMMGNKRHLGHYHSVEARQKMSVAHTGRASGNKGKKASAETRAKMSVAHVGKSWSTARRRTYEERGIAPETRAKISAANMGNASSLGRHPSKETRRRLAEILARIRTSESCAKGGCIAAHRRWHVLRGISSPACALCGA